MEVMAVQESMNEYTSSIKKAQKTGARQPFPINKKTIDRIIYPVYTKKGIKYGKKRAGSMEMKPQDEPKQEPQGKLLDGFLILYSCRVKLPHEAIKSKLTSQKIFEVIEEDLCYFQNLNSIDLADNKVRLEQLKNLKALSDINLQYNMISAIPPILKEDFPKLENLNLSFNLISPTSIRSMFTIPRLKTLDLSGNNLMTFPEDMMEFKCLEELNLSSNLFSSQSTLVNPALLIKAIGQMPKLKRLNLSRNKFQFFHS
jgi:Leucine-rich repeat (LRR) protein